MARLTHPSTIIILFLFWGHANAFADELRTKVGKTFVTLTIPNGHCELQRSNPYDARLIGYLEEANANYNQLLLAFADCEQISRQLIYDYGYVLVPLAFREKTIKEAPARFIKFMCQENEKLLDKIFENIKGPIEKRVEELVPSILVNETRYLGVLRVDAKSCYIGLIQKLQTDAGLTYTMASIWSIAIIRGKIVFQYLWKKFDGGRTIDDLIGLQRIWIDDLYKSN